MIQNNLSFIEGYICDNAQVYVGSVNATNNDNSFSLHYHIHCYVPILEFFLLDQQLFYINLILNLSSLKMEMEENE
jgi:hypothetical protein